MRKRWIVLGVLALIALFGVSLRRTGMLESVTRNSYGDGKRKETYLVTVDGVMENEEITVEISEQIYTSEQIRDMFQQVMELLDQKLLGENDSKDYITKDLVLPTMLDDFPVEILWEMDRYDIIGNGGKLITENLSKEGTLVELRGQLFYGEEEALYVTHVYVFPEEKTGKEKWISDVEEAFSEQEKVTREEKEITLPKVVGGKKVTWKEKPNMKGIVVMFLGAFLGVIWKIHKRQEEKEREEKRLQQMKLDYPEIVSMFSLLISTGMTVKNAWNKIVHIYEEEKQSGKNRFAYEEMCVTSREMKGGITEMEAYERFGRRCNLSIYMKFSMLLSQNLRKGNKGLSELLKSESIQALEKRKQLAKKKGEEASTKMLLPMFAMFAVVLVIIMIPAFLSIQL